MFQRLCVKLDLSVRPLPCAMIFNTKDQLFNWVISGPDLQLFRTDISNVTLRYAHCALHKLCDPRDPTEAYITFKSSLRDFVSFPDPM